MEAERESQTAEWLNRRPAWLRRAAPVALPLAAGLALRLWMIRPIFNVDGDSLVYGGIARNLILHGRYALTISGGELHSTLIRLPGYPLFLALCFKLFGLENYFAAVPLQIAIDLLGCVLIAGFVRRIVPERASRRAALATLWLAALCPFTAAYAVMPLAETLSVFMLALGLWAMARFRDDPRWPNALWFTFAVTAATLLRPDGALAAIAFAPALFAGFGRDRTGSRVSLRKLVRMAAVCVLLALAPFAVWTARNWRVFHVVQPLAPRMANDPGESTSPGWERWVKSWCLDFISTYQVYWNVPGEKLDVSELPSRAFDSPAQYAETAALAEQYNQHGMDLTPKIDAGFGGIATERIAAHPLRFYLWLPLGRVADMWLRPRVENLPIDLDWWVYAHHWQDTDFGWAYAGLNALYLLLAMAGLCSRPRFWGVLAAYMLLRSALLWTVAAPETRYTIECFPMLFALGGVALSPYGWLGKWRRTS
ncbi:MAG: glycosyltransferase family 39 protein [Terracidiphilus sp.]